MPIATNSSPLKGDRPFTCADLRTLSFDKLIDRDPQELAKLLAAGEKEGFFYLDLTKPESQGLYKDYEDILSFMKVWFDNPLEEKTKYAYGSDTQGYESSSYNHSPFQGKADTKHSYKPIGTQTGATENSKDGFETLRVTYPLHFACSECCIQLTHLNQVAQNGLTCAEKPLPPAILDNSTLFNAFISKTRFHVIELLTCFSDALGLLGRDRYENAHRDHKPSNSSMTFHRYPRQSSRDISNVGHNKHTDISSLAFLFAQQWGLQVTSSPTIPGL